MATTLLTVSSIPTSFSVGSAQWPGTSSATATALNSGTWRFTFTPTAASTTYTGGNYHPLFAWDHGGLWLVDAHLQLFTTPGDALVFDRTLAWTAGAAITVTINAAAKQVTISGAGLTSGGGTFSFTTAGPYFDGTQTLYVGSLTGYTFTGTISSVDDGVQGGSIVASPITWSASPKAQRTVKAQPSAVTWSSTATGAKNARIVTATAPAIAWSAGASSLRTRIVAASPPAVAWSSGATGAKVAPISIGVHVMDSQPDPYSNRNAALTLNTQASGSMVVLAAGGNTSSLGGTWTDNKGNTIRKLAAPATLPDWSGYGSQVGVTQMPMAGGSGHTFAIPVANNDENTSFAVEVIGGGRAKYVFSSHANAGATTSQSVGPITTDGAAVLISFAWGASPVVPPFSGTSGPSGSGEGTPFVLSPDSGFTTLEAQLHNYQYGEVQGAMAAKAVTSAGSYSLTWTLGPAQGADIWLVAVEPPRSSAATPAAITWSSGATGVRSRIVAASAPALSWSSGITGARTRIVTAAAPPVAWSAAAGSMRALVRAAVASAISWSAAPAGLRARRGAASAPAVTWGASVGSLRSRVSAAVAPAVSWSASVGALRSRLQPAVAPAVAWSSGVNSVRTRIVQASAPSLAWSSLAGGVKGRAGSVVAPAVTWTAAPRGLRSLLRAASAPSLAWSASASGAKQVASGRVVDAVAPAVVWQAAPVALRSRVSAAAAPAIAWRSYASGGKGSADPILALQDAIWSWVVATCGLADDHVIWLPDGTAGPSPAGTYIGLRLNGIDRVSRDWTTSTSNGDGTATATIRGTRHPDLEITCYVGDTDGAGAAKWILDRVLTRRARPDIAAALRAAGIGMGSPGSIKVIPGSRSGLYDPFARVSIPLVVLISDSYTIGTLRTVAPTVDLA